MSAGPGRRSSTWLFSRRLDLSVFLGSAVLSFAALAVGAASGVLHDETPGWAFIPAVILCDVAHVWSTLFQTYLDPEARVARRRLFVVAPIVGLALSVSLYAAGSLVFWRALAYLAIFHFVRQQYGWVALYRAKAGDDDGLGRVVDTAAIYAATLYPLFYWHIHTRHFSWFIAGDIAALPRAAIALMPVATAFYATALGAYALRAMTLYVRGRGNPGKDIVVLTTALTWYVGIVALDSDYAFTVTNVFVHGIPYFALIHTQTRRARATRPKSSLGSRIAASVPTFLLSLWAIAFIEEALWDRAVFHDRPWLFGEGSELTRFEFLLVPILALPQLTHYVLDGFIWRRRKNPTVASLVTPL